MFRIHTLLLSFFLCCGCAIDIGGEFPYLVYGSSPGKSADRSYFRGINRVQYKVRIDTPKEWDKHLGSGFGPHLKEKFIEAFESVTPGIWRSNTEDRKIPPGLGEKLTLSLSVGKPTVLCTVKEKIDNIRTKNPKDSSQMLPQGPIGLRIYEIPIRIEWMKGETGKRKTIFLNSRTEIYGEPGDPACPSALDGIGTALQDASVAISKRIFPETKKLWMIFYPESKDENIADYLSQAYANITGESPDPEAARNYWEQADRISKGGSWEVSANLGGYYFMIGYPEEAIPYFRKALVLPGAPVSYLKNMIRMAESEMAVRK